MLRQVTQSLTISLMLSIVILFPTRIQFTAYPSNSLQFCDTTLAACAEQSNLLMDPLSITAGVLPLVALAAKVAKELHSLYNAPQEILDLATEVGPRLIVCPIAFSFRNNEILGQQPPRLTPLGSASSPWCISLSSHRWRSK